jgi:hypothetical protein
MEIHMAPHLELEHDVIYFDKGDPKVSRADEVDKINNAAKFLSLLSSDLNAVVKGHASFEGNAKFNQSLSEDRANTVRDLLRALGVLNLPLTAYGVGATEPAAAETAKVAKELEAQRQQNRRVEIIVTSNPTLVQQPKPANIWKRIDHLPQPGPMGQRRLQVPPRFRKPPHLRSKEMPDYKKDLDDWFKANHIDPKLLIGGVLGIFKDYEDAPDDDSPPGSGNDDD